MIITEIKTINGRDFTYTYSDENMMIMRDGVLYSEAYDPVETNRTYEESSTPIETRSPEDEERTEDPA